MLLLIICAIIAGACFGIGFIGPAKDFIEGLFVKLGDFFKGSAPEALVPYLSKACASYVSGVHFVLGAVFTVLAFVGVILSAVRKKYIGMIIKLLIMLASVAALVCSLII